MTLATEVLGPERAEPFVRSHAERNHVLVAAEGDHVLGVLAYRTDWFQCTLVGLVGVRGAFRRRGIARALYKMVEGVSPSPRLYSTVEKTSADGIKMDAALGFIPLGAIDNLPECYRALPSHKAR